MDSLTYIGRLPSGDDCYDVETYLRAWYSVIIPLEEALGLQVIGFDPGLLCTDSLPGPDRGRGRSQIDLPMWVVTRILERSPGAGLPETLTLEQIRTYRESKILARSKGKL